MIRFFFSDIKLGAALLDLRNTTQELVSVTAKQVRLLINTSILAALN